MHPVTKPKTASRRQARRRSGQGLAGRLLRGAVYVTMALAAALVLVPFAWLLCAAFKPADRIFETTFLPRSLSLLTLASFRQLFDELPFLRYMANSAFLATGSTLLTLWISSMAAFALAKYEFTGKKTAMIVMLASMMIPGQLLLAPMYELIYQIGWMDTYLALLIPGAASVFGAFLMRQSMLRLPDELLDAGRIDGCSEWRLYWTIVLPMSRPIMGAFSLVVFMGSWNGFLWPQIVLRSEAKYTLPIALNNMMGVYSQEYGLVMAGTLLSIVPVMIMFFLLQREFIAGLTEGAVKG